MEKKELNILMKNSVLIENERDNHISTGIVYFFAVGYYIIFAQYFSIGQ